MTTETRLINCPCCRARVHMAIDYIRGSHAILFACPRCDHRYGATDIIGRSIPGGLRPLTEDEIAVYRSQTGTR